MWLIIILPVVVGFMIALTQYSRLKFMEIFFKVEGFIFGLPTWIKSKIKIVGDLIYKYRDLPKLRNKTRNGDDSALAKRLQNSDRGSTRYGNTFR